MGLLAIILMSFAVAAIMNFGEIIHREKTNKKDVIIGFIILLIFFIPGLGLYRGLGYKQGLVDGAMEQLRGNTEIKITIDENNIPVDTIITVNKKYIDMHL